jgi:hypothetical protein
VRGYKQGQAGFSLHPAASSAVFGTQNDRHDTIKPVRKQFVVAGAGLFSSDAPRFSISMLDAEGPVDAVAPGLPWQADSDKVVAMTAAVVAIRIMRTTCGDRAT